MMRRHACAQERQPRKPRERCLLLDTLARSAATQGTLNGDMD